MLWLVINLKKYKTPIAVLTATIGLLLVLSLTVGSISTAHDSELFISAAKDVNDSRIIIIDAGHGGEDGGAIGYDGVLEKDLALSIAFEVGRELEKHGYAVVYTRTDDRLLYEPEQNVKGIRKISDLKNRCALAALYPESLLVSIHMNSFAQEKYSGLQVYYSDNNELSRSVAVSVQSRVKEDVQPNNNRAVKKGKGIYILENSSNPAILIECGFLSNRAECEKLLQKEYQKQLSFSIVCGIIDVLE